MGNKNKKNRATEVLRRLVSTLRGAFRKVSELIFTQSPHIFISTRVSINYS